MEYLRFMIQQDAGAQNVWKSSTYPSKAKLERKCSFQRASSYPTKEIGQFITNGEIQKKQQNIFTNSQNIIDEQKDV